MQKSKIITALISLVAATFLWVYVVTVVNPDGETTISNIPVTFSGQEVLREDHSLVISGSEIRTVSVHFAGKNSDMKKLVQYRDQIQAVVDVSKVRSARDYTYYYDLTLPNEVQSSAVEVVEQNPNTITFSVERYVTRYFEIVADLSKVNVAEGYMLKDYALDLDTIQVQGPESAVSKIAAVRVAPNRTNLSKTVSQTIGFDLVDAAGKPVDRSELRLETEEVDLTLNINKVERIPLDVSFIDGGGATSKDVTYEIVPPYVTLAGDAATFDGLNKIDLGNIDLGILANHGEYSFPILIPNGAENVDGAENAVVTVEIKNRATRDLVFTEFEFIGVMEGYQPVSITRRLTVKVRAGEDQIAWVSTNRVRGIVDMSHITQPGIYTVPVEFAFDSIAGAGAVGNYTITVSLEPIPEPEPEPEPDVIEEN